MHSLNVSNCFQSFYIVQNKPQDELFPLYSTHLGLISLAASARSSSCTMLSSSSSLPLFLTEEESLRRLAPDAFIRPWHWAISSRSESDQYVSWLPRASASSSSSSSSSTSPNGSWASARAWRETSSSSYEHQLCFHPPIHMHILEYCIKNAGWKHQDANKF